MIRVPAPPKRCVQSYLRDPFAFLTSAIDENISLPPFLTPFFLLMNNFPLLVDTDASSLVFETHQVIMSEPYLISDSTTSEEQIADNEDEAAWIAEFLTTDEDPMEPISDYYYPIIDTGIDSLNLNSDETYDKTHSKVLGMLSISVYWRDAIKKILPEGSRGLVAVFENECSPSFTYQIDGEAVTYLGGGDLHDREYTHLGMGSWLFDLKDFAIEDQTYSGRPVNEQYCPMHVTIYPSDTMKARFVSDLPIIFTVVGILIFAFTSAIFVLYDWYVERRHRVVNRTAVQNKTIVESLFPEFVRNEVEEVVTHNDIGRKNHGNGHAPASTSRLAAFLNDNNSDDGKPEHPLAGKSKPIADLFEDTTVMFGKYQLTASRLSSVVIFFFSILTIVR